MLDQEKFYKALKNNGIRFFCGVPDSHLNAFCTYLAENVPDCRHVIAANEGSAIAIAAGNYFVTGKTPFVYMQNSGLGNALNPLVSLVDRNVYSVPMILLIGWRGDPADRDHEQHKTQGRITTPLMGLLDLPYRVVADDNQLIDETVSWAVKTAQTSESPVALIARKGVFAEKDKKPPVDDSFPMSREDAIKVILDNTPRNTLFVATTGRATRELYFLRQERGEPHHNDVLNVGAMGHASSIAMGMALSKPERPVICLDGDAAAIMHMGVFTTVSRYPLPNYIHIILNNGAHESVGGQISAGQGISFEEIANGSGFRAVTVDNAADLAEAIKGFSDMKAASLIDVRIRQGMRSFLPPLNIDHSALIAEFMRKNTDEECN